MGMLVWFTLSFVNAFFLRFRVTLLFFFSARRARTGRSVAPAPVRYFLVAYVMRPVIRTVRVR